MRPKALIEELGLLAPVYKKTASYGHFGRNEFSWESTDRAAKIADDLLGGKAASKSHANGAKASRKGGKRGVSAEA